MKLLTLILWVIVAALAVEAIIGFLIPEAVRVLIGLILLVSFAVIHGVLRYKMVGFAAFAVIALVVSNILENLSITTGFPFGHYHYTDVLGPKLLLVPIAIGPAYVAVGYISWAVATVLAGEIKQKSNWLTSFSVPFTASFLMVAWDLVMDPTSSTIGHQWIWEQGGGYFGVPLTNFLGWFFTVYIFFQLFAIYLQRSGSTVKAEPSFPFSHYLQAIVMYAVIGLGYIVQYFVATNSLITDASGAVWSTSSIYESAAATSIFTMLFIAAYSTLKLAQGRYEANLEKMRIRSQVAKLALRAVQLRNSCAFKAEPCSSDTRTILLHTIPAPRQHQPLTLSGDIWHTILLLLWTITPRPRGSSGVLGNAALT